MTAEQKPFGLPQCFQADKVKLLLRSRRQNLPLRTFIQTTEFARCFSHHPMAVIHFQFEDSNIAPKTVEGDFQDMSILELTEEYDVHLNHNCGGVCACSTCHLYVEQGEDSLEEISDKEEDFIDRAINPRLESRLACQCVILNNAAQITVTIPDQKRIIGHEH